MPARHATMIVIVDKLGYTIPSGVRQSILRTLGSKTALEHGLTLGSVRRLVRERIRGKLHYNAATAPVAPHWSEEPRVADVLAGRWVRAWVKDGTLEVVARGRYRRAARGGA